MDAPELYGIVTLLTMMQLCKLQVGCKSNAGAAPPHGSCALLALAVVTWPCTR
jgi:hypothetical protein